MRLTATRAERILPVFVLLIAIFLRLYSLDSIPGGLLFDEVENELDALAIIESERPIFLPENHGREALFVYIQALSMVLLGQTDLALRVVSAIFGILTVAAAYLLVKRMFGSRTALLTCGWLSLSLWHVIFSRIGLRTISLPLFLAVGFYCLWRGLEGVKSQVEARNSSPLSNINRPRPLIWFTIGGVVIGLSLYTYSTARFAPFVIAALALYVAFLHRQLLRQSLPGLALALATSALVFLPLGNYFLNNPEAFVTRAEQVTIFNQALQKDSFLQTLLDSASLSLGMFVIQGDANWSRNISGWSMFDPISALIMLVGTVLAMRRFREPAYGFIVIWLVVMLVPSLLSIKDSPNYYRVTGLIPAIFILPALGASWLWEAWESHGPARLQALPVFLAVLLFLGGTIHTYHSYFEIWAKSPEIGHFFTMDRSVPIEVFCETIGMKHRSVLTSDDGPEPELPVPARFGEQVFVYGFDLPKDVRSGETMTVRWYWRILSVDEREFALTIQLFGEDDRRHGQLDERCFIPDYWPVGTSGVSTLSIQVDPEAPTGAYRLHAAIYDRTRHIPSNLPVFDTQGRQAGDQLILGPIKVHSRRPAQASEGRFSNPPVPDSLLPANFADQINLRGYRLSDRRLVPGESLDLTLFWAPRGRPSGDYTVFVHLLDSQEQIQSQADSPPRAGQYPTSIWDAGEVIADLHTISLGPDLPAGEYRLAIGLYDPETGERVGIVDGSGQITEDRLIISGLSTDG